MKSPIARIGSGVALAAILGLSTFVSTAQAPTVSADSYVHSDFAGKSLLPCIAGDAGNDTPVSEAWRLPAGGLTYYVNTASIPIYLNNAEVVDAVQSAAASWTAAGAPALVYGGAVLKDGWSGDGKTVINFATNGNTKGVAKIIMRIKDGVMAEADLELDGRTLWATNQGASGDCGGNPLAWDVQSVMAHEFGHMAGAKHAPNTAEYGHRSTHPMIAAGELKKRTLSAGDIASIPSQAAPSSGVSTTVVLNGDDDG